MIHNTQTKSNANEQSDINISTLLLLNTKEQLDILSEMNQIIVFYPDSSEAKRNHAKAVIEQIHEIMMFRADATYNAFKDLMPKPTVVAPQGKEVVMKPVKGGKNTTKTELTIELANQVANEEQPLVDAQTSITEEIHTVEPKPMLTYNDLAFNRRNIVVMSAVNNVDAYSYNGLDIKALFECTVLTQFENLLKEYKETTENVSENDLANIYLDVLENKPFDGVNDRLLANKQSLLKRFNALVWNPKTRKAVTKKIEKLKTCLTVPQMQEQVLIMISEGKNDEALAFVNKCARVDGLLNPITNNVYPHWSKLALDIFFKNLLDKVNAPTEKVLALPSYDTEALEDSKKDYTFEEFILTLTDLINDHKYYKATILAKLVLTTRQLKRADDTLSSIHTEEQALSIVNDLNTKNDNGTKENYKNYFVTTEDLKKCQIETAAIITEAKEVAENSIKTSKSPNGLQAVFALLSGKGISLVSDRIKIWKEVSALKNKANLPIVIDAVVSTEQPMTEASVFSRLSVKDTMADLYNTHATYTHELKDLKQAVKGLLEAHNWTIVVNMLLDIAEDNLFEIKPSEAQIIAFVESLVKNTAIASNKIKHVKELNEALVQLLKDGKDDEAFTLARSFHKFRKHNDKFIQNHIDSKRELIK